MKVKKEMESFRSQIVRGLNMSHKRMLAFKKSKNSPVVYSKDGKILKVDASEFDNSDNS